jgi:hypothetical protein
MMGLLSSLIKNPYLAQSVQALSIDRFDRDLKLSNREMGFSKCCYDRLDIEWTEGPRADMANHPDLAYGLEVRLFRYLPPPF